MSGERDFWSRRRAGVQAEAEAERAAQEAHALAETHEALEEKTDDEILAELNLPDPDTLKQGDDFSVFMAKIVPDRIRRRALRTLWRSNPVLANVDALVDYGEDFTDSAMVVENLQTAYQVGKGMLRHVEEMARQAEAKAAAEDENSEPATAEVADEPEMRVASAPEPEREDPPIEEASTEDEVYVAPAPRRMKFVAEGSAA